MTVGTAWQRVAAGLGPVLVVLGAIGVMVGVLQVLDAAGDVLEEVAVPVRLTTSDGLGADLALEVGGEPFDGVRVSGVPAGGAPDTDPRSDPLGIVVIHAPTRPWESGSSRGPTCWSAAQPCSSRQSPSCRCCERSPGPRSWAPTPGVASESSRSA